MTRLVLLPLAALPWAGAIFDANPNAMPAVSVGYTIGVLALGGLGLLVSLVLLCLPAPPIERKRTDR